MGNALFAVVWPRIMLRGTDKLSLNNDADTDPPPVRQSCVRTISSSTRCEFSWNIQGISQCAPGVQLEHTFKGAAGIWKVCFWPLGRVWKAMPFPRITPPVELTLTMLSHEQREIEIDYEVEILGQEEQDVEKMARRHRSLVSEESGRSFMILFPLDSTELLDPEKGYLLDDCIEVRVRIAVFKAPIHKPLEPFKYLHAQNTPKQPSIFDTVRNNLNAMRLHDQLCDARLYSELETEFRVHKLVLSIQSNFFKEVFRSAESFDLHYPDEVVSQLIEYLYTGSCDFKTYCESLIQIAHSCQIPVLYEMCEEYVIWNLFCTKNFAQTHVLARKVQSRRIQNYCSEMLSIDLYLSEPLQEYEEAEGHVSKKKKLGEEFSAEKSAEAEDST